jgi:excinuclease UvrABC ATPase subunit
LAFTLAHSTLPWQEVKPSLQRAGFHRLLDGENLRDLEELDEAPAGKAPLQVVVDRFAYRAENHKRIADSLEQAFHYGKGKLNLYFPQDKWRREPFSNHLRCPHCDTSYRDPVPNIFLPTARWALRDLPRFRPSHRHRLDLVIPDPASRSATGRLNG